MAYVNIDNKLIDIRFVNCDIALISPFKIN